MDGGFLSDCGMFVVSELIFAFLRLQERRFSRLIRTNAASYPHTPDTIRGSSLSTPVENFWGTIPASFDS